MRGCTNMREGETEDHSTQHNLEYPGHCLQLNMSSWRAWCYKCQAEVFLTKNKPVVRGGFGKKKSSSGNTSSNIDKYLGVMRIFIALNLNYSNSFLKTYLKNRVFFPFFNVDYLMK